MENRERECKHRIKIGASILTMQKRSSILASTDKLDKTERAKILHLLCEGMSIRAITRLTGVSKTTVSKLVADAGQAGAWYQDRVFQSLTCKRLQIDEIWGFIALFLASDESSFITGSELFVDGGSAQI